MSKLTVSIKARAMATEDDTTRRAALRALVDASAFAIPTISASARAPTDPIFTAIARHRAACETRCAVDDLIYAPGREVSQAEWDAWERAQENEDAAFDELFAGGAEVRRRNESNYCSSHQHR